MRVILALLFLLALFILEENLRGRILLACYTAELRARGEKLTLTELALAQRPTDGRGVTELLALTNQFNALREECPFPVDAVWRLWPVGHGRAIARCRQPDLGVERLARGLWLEVKSFPMSTPAASSGRTNQPATAHRATWDDLTAQTERAADTVRKLRAMLAQPLPGVAIDYTQGLDVRLPHLNVTRAAARWLAWAALHDLHAHDCAAAASNILAIAALTRFQENQRLTISQIVRRAVAEIGLTLTWEALQTPGWTDDQLLALQQAWQSSSTIQSTVPTLEMERVIYRRAFAQARRLPGWNELRLGLLYEAQCGCGHYSRAHLSTTTISLVTTVGPSGHCCGLPSAQLEVVSVKLSNLIWGW